MNRFGKTNKSFTLLVLLALFLTVPSVIAETQLALTPVTPFVFKELNTSAQYEVTVFNDNPQSDDFNIDTLLDMEMIPKNLGFIASGETKKFLVSVNPSQELKDKQAGKSLAFEYFVWGDAVKLKKADMVTRVVSIPDSLNIGFPPAVDPKQREVAVKMSFKESVTLKATVKATSDLFTNSFPITLSNAEQEVILRLDDLSSKNAGVYKTTFTLEIEDGQTASVEKDVVLSPVINVDVKQETTGGILSSETKVTKTNNGNSATKVTISLNRSVVSSLFTTFNDSPKTRKEGGVYLYEWEKEINPGEAYTVYLKTNYYVPFGVFLLLLLALVIFKIVTKSPVEIVKKVGRVRTKSGAFASKIILSVKNTGKPVTNVKVIDRLPAFTEILQSKFSVLTPSEIKKRSVVWSIPQMSTGEEIMFSYMVYSKVNILGKLEVPPAVVTFIDSKDNFLEAQSEKIFIISEDEKKVEDENLPL